jgi:hypothetical protein
VNPRFYNTDVATEHYLGMRWGRAIWQAVLEQAIRDIVEGPSVWEMRGLTLAQMNERRLQFKEAAQRWVDDEENEPRRFVWACMQLELDPTAVRASIEKRSKG